MSDGLRTVLYWLSAGMGVVGLALIVLALLQGAFRSRVQETTPWRVTSLAILLLAAGVTVAAIAFIWPHPPE
ncbi:hypothetical protein [Cryptosporangium arvum]|uniref:Uncharacterized protein n=1 Tax=Cryptosporangium arvum DSM 44712 TaxID=927661 RepID=A0A011ADK7_9ACTN|nr:hypothetical protein [Cryptosporangium arvum]EXG80136.1 hypothetical protein CryarDRAFT_1201 [Cryptosporangium arvum DSM 44712]